MYGPIIQGSQFRLRPPRLEDAAPFLDWFADQEVTAHLAMRMGLSLEFEHGWLRRAEESRDTILWVIEHDGRVVGNTVITRIEGNEASRRAQLAAGYREVGRLHREYFRNGRWIDQVITELLREDWQRGRQPLTNL